MNESYQKIKQMPIEELILLGIQGINYISYINPSEDKYFSIEDICKFTRDVSTLEDFETNYAVTITNLVLDGEI